MLCILHELDKENRKKWVNIIETAHDNGKHLSSAKFATAKSNKDKNKDKKDKDKDSKPRGTPPDGMSEEEWVEKQKKKKNNDKGGCGYCSLKGHKPETCWYLCPPLQKKG
ncbi:hypothetical protein N7540_000132 [Penicillium herquei]|nr:hypothetical protein N7540_000132 [Penicillium herquei]